MRKYTLLEILRDNGLSEKEYWGLLNEADEKERIKESRRKRKYEAIQEEN